MIPILYRSNFLEEIKKKTSDVEIIKIAIDLHHKGYSILTFPENNFESLAHNIIEKIKHNFNLNEWKKNGWKNNSGLRLQDEWIKNDEIKKRASNEILIKILSICFGKQAFPFQTLNFPVGTQQPIHMDTFHFSSIPKNFMCGVWVALEDISDDAGPLELYEKSHTLSFNISDEIKQKPHLTFEEKEQIYQKIWNQEIKQKKLKRKIFIAKKGECVIWLANLLHGGSKQNNPNLTRWSQVTHYYFENCDYISPALSNFRNNKLFYKDVINIIDSKKVSKSIFSKIKKYL